MLIQKLLPLKICIAHPSLLISVSQCVLNVSFLLISCISINKGCLMVLANPAKTEAWGESRALLEAVYSEFDDVLFLAVTYPEHIR